MLRQDRQQEFKILFEKICTNNILPIEYNGIIYNPNVKEHKEYVEIDYVNQQAEHRYVVYLEREEYDKIKQSK